MDSWSAEYVLDDEGNITGYAKGLSCSVNGVKVSPDSSTVHPSPGTAFISKRIITLVLPEEVQVTTGVDTIITVNCGFNDDQFEIVKRPDLLDVFKNTNYIPIESLTLVPHYNGVFPLPKTVYLYDINQVGIERHAKKDKIAVFPVSTFADATLPDSKGGSKALVAVYEVVFGSQEDIKGRCDIQIEISGLAKGPKAKDISSILFVEPEYSTELVHTKGSELAALHPATSTDIIFRMDVVNADTSSTPEGLATAYYILPFDIKDTQKTSLFILQNGFFDTHASGNQSLPLGLGGVPLPRRYLKIIVPLNDKVVTSYPVNVKLSITPYVEPTNSLVVADTPSPVTNENTIVVESVIEKSEYIDNKKSWLWKFTDNIGRASFDLHNNKNSNYDKYPDTIKMSFPSIFLSTYYTRNKKQGFCFLSRKYCTPGYSSSTLDDYDRVNRRKYCKTIVDFDSRSSVLDLSPNSITISNEWSGAGNAPDSWRDVSCAFWGVIEQKPRIYDYLTPILSPSTSSSSSSTTITMPTRVMSRDVRPEEEKWSQVNKYASGVTVYEVSKAGEVVGYSEVTSGKVKKGMGLYVLLFLLIPLAIAVGIALFCALRKR